MIDDDDAILLLLLLAAVVVVLLLLLVGPTLLLPDLDTVVDALHMIVLYCVYVVMICVEGSEVAV